ncbi:MAG: YbjN domain-containing protein [Acidimicrobiia bacterium]|nr:YbjN domain-containing protein [Acidimicrobiia bacterium]
MAMDLDRLKALCEGEGFKYFLAPDRPTVMMGFSGIYGRYQTVVHIEVDGRFIQVRTVGYLNCPADHPHSRKVLEILGHLNYQLRLTKFGWDPSDGEIVAYADVWLEDGEVTQKQFGALFRSLLPAIDRNYKRLTVTMETGEDPGEITPESAAGDAKPPKLQV